MKLKIVGFESELNLDDYYVNVVEIHNKNLFHKIISQLYDKHRGLDVNNELKIIDDIEEINFKKDVYFVDNYFNVDANNRRIINRLYMEIVKNILDYGYGSEYDLLINNLIKLILHSSNEISINITFDNKIEINDFLKLLNIKIDEPMYCSIKENLYLLIDILSEFKMHKFILLCNLKNYIPIDELKELYKYSQYRKIKLVLIENVKDNKIENENKLIIDENYDDYIV